MAGFFSPGLGFASGVGAFIGGAAQEGNRLINEQRAQDRQDDIIWMNKFERGLSEYNKDKKSADQQAQMYNSFLQLSGGNKQLADVAMNHVLMNPKGYEDAVQMITTQKNNPQYNNNSYQSNFNPYSGLNEKYQNLDQMRQGVRPQAQRFMQMPDQPQGMPGSNYSPQVQPGQPQMVSTQGQPQMPPGGDNAASVQYTNGPNGEPVRDVTRTAGGPDQMVGQPQGPQAQPIPTQMPSGQPQAPQGNVYPAQPGQGLYGAATKPMTQYQQQELQLHQDANKLRQQELQWRMSQKPSSPQEAADIAIASAAAKTYLDDPKQGLQARHNQLPDYQSQLNDINGIMSMINQVNGLKADALQEGIGNLNRFTTAALGLDLSKFGVSNKVEDVNLIKKEIANAMIDRLKTLHFGRITNYTESIVKQGMPSLSNDPNTNAKIALAIKSTIESAVKGTQVEYQTAFGTPSGNPTMQSVGAARKAKDDYISNYMKQNEGAPWLQMKVDDPNKLPMLAKLEPGTWFENAEKGGNGKMYRIIGPTQDNSYLQIMDASGKIVGVPLH